VETSPTVVQAVQRRRLELIVAVLFALVAWHFTCFCPSGKNENEEKPQTGGLLSRFWTLKDLGWFAVRSFILWCVVLVLQMNQLKKYGGFHLSSTFVIVLSTIAGTYFVMRSPDSGFFLSLLWAVVFVLILRVFH
jgi:FtsH-binding integral membrane protein